MTEPQTALTVAGLIAGVLALLFWPSRGLFWRWQQLHQLGERVMIEDALKHFFKYEYFKRTATVESLSRSSRYRPESSRRASGAAGKPEADAIRWR